MIVRWLSAFVALAIVGAAAGALAASSGAPKIEKTPVPLPPKPDFSSMQFQLGSWSCSTKSARRPAAFVTDSVTTMDSSGYWMVTKSVTHKMAWFPVQTRGTDYVTYDADTKRWVDVSTGDLGAYGVTTSPGWNGNTIVWTDALFKPGMDVIAQTPAVTTKMSDTKTTTHSTFREKSGRWISVNTVCTKSG